MPMWIIVLVCYSAGVLSAGYLHRQHLHRLHRHMVLQVLLFAGEAWVAWAELRAALEGLVGAEVILDVLGALLEEQAIEKCIEPGTGLDGARWYYRLRLGVLDAA